MISLNKITLQRGIKILLQDSTATIFPKQKIGLVGKNGCGKSSLFDLLLGKLIPEKGTVDVQNNLKINHLKQTVPQTNQVAIEYVMEGNQTISKLFKQLKIAEQNHQHQLICELHEKLFITNAYSLKAEAGKILNGLGFKPKEHEKSVNNFSGGWKMRLNLAQTLIAPCDIMLLDEPTNHLDLDAIIWLEKWLKEFSGAVIIISHDRDFLDHVINRTIHIEYQKLNSYGGNYSYFEEQRALKLTQQQAQFKNQQKKLKKINYFIDRFRYKATKAKQVQSRIKALERMERVAEIHAQSEFHFEFKKPQKYGAPLFKMESVNLGYGEKLVLKDIELQINPGDRIGLLGHNGAGKSTLMKSLSGKLTPLAGSIHQNKNSTIGYFAQELVEQLNFDKSPLQHLEKIHPKSTTAQLRNFLGGFHFSNNMAISPIRHFSGGEKARLVLALIVWQAPSVLILDEPTNHLDMEMREALNLALQNYEGALVLVSHDRYLLRTSVDTFYLINNQTLQEFKGDVDDYAQWVLDNKNENYGISNSQTAHKDKSQAISTKIEQVQKKVKKKDIKKLENQLNKLYKSQKEIEQLLADTQLYQSQNSEKLKKLLIKQGNLKKEINNLEEDWMVLNQ